MMGQRDLISGAVLPKAMVIYFNIKIIISYLIVNKV
jgi:hypothetical protein